FSATQTLDNAAISIAGTSGGGFLEAVGSGTTLTLGPNLSLTQTGRIARLYAYASDAIVNTGTIDAGVAAGSMYVRGGGSFTNQGVINVSNGEIFNSSLTISGTGTIALASGGVVSVTTAVASGQVISFADGAA